jgi:nitrate reductase NapE component
MSLIDFPSYALDAIVEIHSLLPDSILFGSLLLYFLTHHMAFGVFALFLMEIVGAHRLTAWMFSQSVGPTRSSGPLRCRAGFKTPQYQYQRIFSHESYPSYSIFSVTAIATYLGLSTSAFSPTMEQMGPEWASRSTVAYVFIGLFLLSFFLARLWSCEGMTELFIAMLLAILTGVIFFYVNQAIFGVEAVNFLGLPYLVRKDKEGTPIYVCSPTGSSS